MTDNDSALTIYQLLEIVIGLVTIIGPLVGVIWYAENRLHEMDTRLIQLERVSQCILNAAINDVKPTYCSGD